MMQMTLGRIVKRLAHLDRGDGTQKQDEQAVAVEHVAGRHPQDVLEEKRVDLKQQKDDHGQQALQHAQRGGHDLPAKGIHRVRGELQHRTLDLYNKHDEYMQGIPLTMPRKLGCLLSPCQLYSVAIK